MYVLIEIYVLALMLMHYVCVSFRDIKTTGLIISRQDYISPGAPAPN